MEQQPQVPMDALKQVIYPPVEVGVQLGPDGSRVMIVTTPFEQLVFPMTAEAAQQIGWALSAPSVVVPQPAANGGLL
jgi:hypothetical protein